MLASFFDIKPVSTTSHPPDSPAPKPPKPPKPPKQQSPKPSSSNRQRQGQHRVDPYEGGAMHAQFKPSPVGSEPQGLAGASVSECEVVGDVPMDDAARDPYEYLMQEVDQVGCAEEDDTDSCLTFEDDVSDISHDALSSSPADNGIDVLEKAFFSKRKARASETPVYTGPELWYEDDDFIV